jgi:hypothetical protein
MGYFLDNVECRLSGRSQRVLGSAALDDGCVFDAISVEFLTRMGGDKDKDLEPELECDFELADGRILTPFGWTNMVCKWDEGTQEMKGRFIVLPKLAEDIFFSKDTRRKYRMRKSTSKKAIGGNIWMLRPTRKTKEQVQLAKERAAIIRKANEEDAKKEEQDRAKSSTIATTQRSQQSQGLARKK